ncbi:MAG: type II toxin-antitoxin system Phd/YefM family antitoxin [Methylorubrum populi]
MIGPATLNRMTGRTHSTDPETTPERSWRLADARARFGELVRRVRSEGPQHVTVRGQEEVVVISAEDFRRLKGQTTGEALVAALQASPDREIEIEPERFPMPVRDPIL